MNEVIKYLEQELKSMRMIRAYHVEQRERYGDDIDPNLQIIIQHFDNRIYQFRQALKKLKNE